MQCSGQHFVADPSVILADWIIHLDEVLEQLRERYRRVDVLELQKVAMESSRSRSILLVVEELPLLSVLLEGGLLSSIYLIEIEILSFLLHWRSRFCHMKICLFMAVQSISVFSECFVRSRCERSFTETTTEVSSGFTRRLRFTF
jgi:hypothetical protein